MDAPQSAGDLSVGSAAPAPAISVVLAACGGFAAVRTTVSALAAQTIRDRLELVIVTPSARALGFDVAAQAVFSRVRVVETGSPVSVGRANAQGVRWASAPIVAFAEDHAFPEPDWAERLVEAHAGPFVAVGPVVANANPATAVSRADHLIGYGPWIAPSVTHEADHLPGHNSSYKRAALLEWGDALDALLESETLLHWRMRERGERLLLVASARIAHVNFSRWRPWLAAQFHAGRTFAAGRRRGMSVLRRALYTGGSPLIPIVRLARIARASWRRGRTSALPGCLHALAIGLAVDALGQAAGYALGAGSSPSALARYEFLRARHLSRRDLADPMLARYASASCADR